MCMGGRDLRPAMTGGGGLHGLNKHDLTAFAELHLEHAQRWIKVSPASDRVGIGHEMIVDSYLARANLLPRFRFGSDQPRREDDFSVRTPMFPASAVEESGR